MRYSRPKVLTTRQAAPAIKGGIPKQVGNNDGSDLPTAAAGYESDE
jgi:hypothetical protein